MAMMCAPASIVASGELPNLLTDPSSIKSMQQIAMDVLTNVAERAFARPHNTSEAEIQILSAFVLGYNSK